MIARANPITVRATAPIGSRRSVFPKACRACLGPWTKGYPGDRTSKPTIW
jgi:hypothetical protein